MEGQIRLKGVATEHAANAYTLVEVAGRCVGAGAGVGCRVLDNPRRATVKRSLLTLIVALPAAPVSNPVWDVQGSSPYTGSNTNILPNKFSVTP